MKSRSVKGFVLPSTGVDLLRLEDGVGVVLSDGRMLYANGSEAPVPVLGPGPRPVAVRGQNVLTIDGSTCMLGEVTPRDVDLDASALIDVLHTPLHTLVVDETGRLCRFEAEAGLQVIASHIDLVFDANEQAALVLDRDGVHVIDVATGLRQWTRPRRGSTGERASTACFVPGGVAVAREAHGLDGLEDESELEVWQDAVLSTCLHLNDVAHALLWTTDGLVVADMSGGVHRCVEGGMITLHRGTSSVLHMLEVDGQVCVASWFNVHGIVGTDVAWTVEHAGMPRRLLAYHDVLFMVGDDGNDWTGVEPLGAIDLAGPPVEMDAGELTMWFPDPEVDGALDVEAAVGVTFSTSEPSAEVVSWRPPAGLMDALSSDPGASIGPTPDEEIDILEVLTDTSTPALVVPFFVDAGGDRRVVDDGKGAVEVLLEPKVTGVPPEGAQFSWLDNEGRELGTRPRLLLKLPTGVHRFEVRVRHPDGRWAMDSITVDVRKASG